MLKFATALTIVWQAASAAETVGTYDPATTDVSEYKLLWEKSSGLSFTTQDASGKQTGKRLISTNKNTSAWTLDRLKMKGWFLNPMTPIDGCFTQPSTEVADEEAKLSWWEIEAEKGKNEAEIRRLMNLQGEYDDCRARIAD